MNDSADQAGLLGGHARPPRTGLARGTQQGVNRSGGSRANAGDLMRLFVAIAPPPAVLDELDTLAGPLRMSRPDLRWTSREAWHVTLAFLGQVDESATARLLPRLERAARRHHCIRLAFCGAGAFPAAGRANVLWSGLSGDRRALARLAESVTAGASRAGTPPPDKGRPFQPHLTLARCRMPADVTELVAALAGFQGQSWTADRVHLVRSRLGATEQPRYSTLASWPLRVPGRDADPASRRPLLLRLAELLQDGHRRPERSPLLGSELGQPPGQPGVFPAPHALHHRPSLLGNGEDHLTPVGGVR